ncbi:MAG: type IV pilus modification protein PilV [Gammaproteobacteria bacterium]|nr:type IV pilus modification protein PilV [Gammaproteobacteria bacterium]
MDREYGFSLLEALIALLVIAVGVLGIAGLQAASIYRTHVGEVKSLAAVEAQSIAAAMLANPGAFPPTVIPPAKYETASAAALSPPAADCGTGICTPAEMAQYDLYVWGNRLQQDLPQGDGAIECHTTAPNPTQCKVTITWRQKRMAPSAGTVAGSIVTRQYSIWVNP